jgi:hypothetical protein
MFSFTKIQVSFNSIAILAAVAVIDLGESLKIVEEGSGNYIQKKIHHLILKFCGTYIVFHIHL